MLQTVSRFFVRVAERWMPDPLVIAIFLTIVSFACAIGFTDFGPTESLIAWGDSFWSLLRFTAQMILILVLGHVLAHTDAVQRLLYGMADRIHSARAAYAGLTLFSGVISLVPGDSDSSCPPFFRD